MSIDLDLHNVPRLSDEDRDAFGSDHSDKAATVIELPARKASRARKKQSGSLSLQDLSDSQEGPLAEARAIADVLNIVAVDGLTPGDNTMPTLTRMLVERLCQVKQAVNAEVANG